MLQKAEDQNLQSSEHLQTVLIVDDDAVNIRLMLELLEKEYRVLVSTSGEQALNLLEKHNDIDLMLLDVDMPGLSGFDVLKRARAKQDYQELPVILVTGRNQVGDEVFGFEQGAVDYIAKPIVGAVLKARVRNQISLATAKDELKRKNLELEKALADMQTAKNELTEFTAMVSHELRTPVSVLACEIELLVDGIRQPDKKNLESLQEEVKHFNTLINDMFDLVMSEARTLKYEKNVCQLDVLLNRSLSIFEKEFDTANIKAHISTEAIEGLKIFADPERIRQVIDNIVINAINYTDCGGKLVVYTERKSGFIWAHFQDSPPGVDEAELERLFERLYRVEKSRNRATGGAGLGLAVCKTIVYDHDGIIQVKKSPYGGLWVSFGLPEYTEE